jgi:hypothetical protein
MIGACHASVPKPIALRDREAGRPLQHHVASIDPNGLGSHDQEHA